jgi:cobalt/nickel transport system permease protein
MHIPDGYLSPSTCAVLYAAAIAGWYSALKRLKRMLLSRVVPLISVFAAFSFVVMMFNLPLPGGTTGHALGVTISVIVLGPSGAVLAISIALAIQALFFGDGGISTLGANCFNMAIVASLVAYASYRLIAAGAGIASKRRVVAAAIAGYLAVNAAALIAAIEFGIQPALFHDGRGMPLYAPYPLSIAVPAMMIGHLTLAGVAEAAISAGLVAYLQAADPGLLRNTAGVLPATEAVSAIMPAATNSLRRLWIAVALLMVLTPLGILVAGKAWGEWSPSELAMRQSAGQAASAANNSVAPSAPPAGMQRLAKLWTAPFPAYAPTFVKSTRFGYFLSAMFAVGIMLLVSLVAQLWVQRRREVGHS